MSNTFYTHVSDNLKILIIPKQEPQRVKNEANAKCQKWQFFKWPHEDGSKRESNPLHPHFAHFWISWEATGSHSPSVTYQCSCSATYRYCVILWRLYNTHLSFNVLLCLCCETVTVRFTQQNHTVKVKHYGRALKATPHSGLKLWSPV